MAISGTFEANGRTWTFRKPFVGPVMRFNEVLALAEEGKATEKDILDAAIAIIHGAVARVEPSVTVRDIVDANDTDDLMAFGRAVMAIRLKSGEEESGEPSRPQK